MKILFNINKFLEANVMGDALIQFQLNPLKIAGLNVATIQLICICVNYAYIVFLAWAYSVLLCMLLIISIIINGWIFSHSLGSGVCISFSVCSNPKITSSIHTMTDVETKKISKIHMYSIVHIDEFNLVHAMLPETQRTKDTKTIRLDKLLN